MVLGDVEHYRRTYLPQVGNTTLKHVCNTKSTIKCLQGMMTVVWYSGSFTGIWQVAMRGKEQWTETIDLDSVFHRNFTLTTGSRLTKKCQDVIKEYIRTENIQINVK